MCLGLITKKIKSTFCRSAKKMKQREEVDSVMPNDSEHLRVYDRFPEKHERFP